MKKNDFEKKNIFNQAKIARNPHKPHFGNYAVITIVLLVKEIIITIKIRICRCGFSFLKFF